MEDGIIIDTTNTVVSNPTIEKTVNVSHIWLGEIFIVINEYPWTSFFVGFWILACLAVTFIEKVK
jgi:hypothetical protein